MIKPVRLLHSLKLHGHDKNKRLLHMKTQYDAVVIGAGHNGLVAAAYLQKAGLDVCVVENRHVIGGASVTEEIVPGFKFSRASYLLSLFRPQIMKDLELKKYGLKVFLRNPNSYTPLITPGGLDGTAKSLTLGRDSDENTRQIAQFSTKDAKAFSEYEEHLDKIVKAIDPLLDNPPMALPLGLTLREKWNNLAPAKALLSSLNALGKDLPGFYDLMTAPAQKILNRWFESEPLKATLATDSVIGAMTSPQHPGSGYVLLHHVMGELEGIKGAWGYVEGGMGGLANAIADCATDHGASIFTNKPVAHVVTENGQAKGVVLKDGTEIKSKLVLSNATPKITYLDLLDEKCLPADVIDELKQFDYTSPVTKINVAVDRIPNFLANPNVSENVPMPHHQASIHLNCEDSQLLHEGYIDAQLGKITEKCKCLPADVIDELKQFDYTSPVTKINVAVDRIPNFLANPNVSENVPMPHHQASIHLNCEDSQLLHEGYIDAQLGKITENPMIEMVIPSSLDQTLCPAGKHAVLLFTQFTPYHLADGEWDDENRNKYADIVFDTIERYAPGFKDSVIGRDILTPPDLEKIIGLTGGNIFHGALSLDQLYLSRPSMSLSNYRSPVPGLYLCGSGAHPGGGVMGAAGRLAANAALSDYKSL